MNIPGTSGALGFTEATSKLDGVAGACPDTPPANHNQRLPDTTVLTLAVTIVLGSWRKRRTAGDKRGGLLPASALPICAL
jgi:hypothetical protein